MIQAENLTEVSKIYKELTKLNSKETNNLIMKWAKDMNRNFTEKTYTWPSKQNPQSPGLACPHPIPTVGANCMPRDPADTHGLVCSSWRMSM